MAAFAFSDQPAYSMGKQLHHNAWKRGLEPDEPGPTSYEVEKGLGDPKWKNSNKNKGITRANRQLSEHFAPEFKRQVPGPGSYALPSCFDLSQRKGSSFGRAPRSTALGRYKKDAIPPRGRVALFEDDLPGPGEYADNTFVNENIMKNKGPTFGVPGGRRAFGNGRSRDDMDVPGPGSYHHGGAYPRNKGPAWGGAPTSSRLAAVPGASDVPGVGSYHVARPLIEKKLAPFGAPGGPERVARLHQQSVKAKAAAAGGGAGGGNINKNDLRLPLREAFPQGEPLTDYYYDPKTQYKGMSSTIGHPQFRYQPKRGDRPPQSARF